MASPSVWLITGASSGLGRSLLEVVLKNGDIAVAALRKPEVLSDLSSKYPKDRLLVIKLDVTKEADITDAFSKIRDNLGRLDIVFNNAGIGSFGEIEATPNEVARGVFEVNFWGVTNISRAALHFFREINPPGVGGTLLQMSSLLAQQASAGVAYYCASKYALEGFSEALAKELDPKWNIKICILELGAFRTGIYTNSPTMPQHHAYTDPTHIMSVLRKLMPSLVIDGDTDKATKMIYELVCRGDLPLRLPLGKDALEATRSKVNSLTAEADAYAKYSDDLLLAIRE
jgi:NAD(P)-dependent dehydrogenase (short-subunit alcohol dehydrogenase family)